MSKKRIVKMLTLALVVGGLAFSMAESKANAVGEVSLKQETAKQEFQDTADKVKSTEKAEQIVGWYVYKYNSSGQKLWLYAETKNGKEILGWYGYGRQPKKARYKLYADKESLNHDWGNNKEIHSVASTAPADLKVQNQFVIRYDGNGASGSMSDTVVTYGEYTKIKKNMFTRSGYVFTGWCAYNETTNKWYVIKKEDESQEWVTEVTDAYYDQAYSDQASVAKTAHPGEVVMFYAQWAKMEGAEKYTITCGTIPDIRANVTSTNDFYDLLIGYYSPSQPANGRGRQIEMKNNTYSIRKADIEELGFQNLPAGAYMFYVEARAVHYFPNYQFFRVNLGNIDVYIKHDFSPYWYADETNHWHACKGCKEKEDVAKHSGGEATCTTKAKCATCGISYGEFAEHTFQTTTTKATLTADGKKESKCTVCGTVTETTIYAAKTIKLSKTTYAYDGKAKKPTVIVKDRTGKEIVTTNYSVKYDAGRKIVGKYNVKITFKGDYKGSKTLSFTVNPKATSLKSVTPASKAFTATWAKQTKQVDGYEMEYALDDKFTNSAKRKTVKECITTSKKISNLKSKKTYYVRVRTYKKVGTKKYYSTWSKPLPVKTKN